ncbi:MAG: AAA family ATPase [bacterium]|nr:AAA family ATPase [bacterium]
MTEESFSAGAHTTLARAQRQAMNFSHKEVEAIHVLRAMLKEQNNLMAIVLDKVNEETGKTHTLENMDAISKTFLDKIPVTQESGRPQMSEVTNQILITAIAFGENEPGGEQRAQPKHILRAFFRVNSPATNVLLSMDIEEKHLDEALGSIQGENEFIAEGVESKTPFLDQYATNLNEQAEKNELDPVIGRDTEIRRVTHILSKRTKNNPILIGEAGVGKTAIVEGIAQRIFDEDVPVNMKGCTLYSLDMAALIAGASFKGEFEQRLKGVIKEVEASNKEFILFIDEIHTILDAGSGGGALSAGELLKPALARGKMATIGATTLNEYQKHIERDSALERRFQKVMVEEPTIGTSVAILRGLQERYENYHKIQFSDDSLVAAVKMSHRYITDRNLPDKAIDLIDEAASKIRLEINSKPEPLDEVDREITQIKIELEAMNSDSNASEKRKKEMLGNLSELVEKQEDLNAKWLREKQYIDEIQELKREHEQLSFDAEQYTKSSNLEEAAKIIHGQLPKNEEKQTKAREKLIEIQAHHKLLKEVVTELEIAEVVSAWTGVPVSKMTRSENEKLLVIEEELHKRVIGQTEAVTEIARSIRVNRVPGIGDPKKPIGSFIFLGTTGVGKTELAKALAEYLFDDETHMIRIDMSEYQEKHTVSRLVGSPPGYVGYDEGGQLTEPVRKRPYNVVLLDEIEKAHPDVLNTLLQVLDDGRLTDNKGRLVNFKNTLIIMTSNIGSRIIQDEFEDANNIITPELLSAINEDVMEELKAQMRPELLNRLDETIIFNPLDQDAINQIVELQLKSFRKNMEEEEYELEWTAEAVELLGIHGYDPQFGARPVKRAITEYVREPLSFEILSGNVGKKTPIIISREGERLAFKNQAPAKKKKEKQKEKQEA